MRCLFTTSNRNGPSTIIVQQMLSHLNTVQGVSIDFFNTDYQKYDVVFFMGYDPQVLLARKMNNTIKVGIIDIRPNPSRFEEYRNADFILANGIEMKDWALQFCRNVFIYYLYPLFFTQPQARIVPENTKIILGYHGNKVHLAELYPRITQAIDKIAEDKEVELWVMYNIREHGKWTRGLPASRNIKVKHIQWSQENYIEYISRVDIGIVPNCIMTHTWQNRANPLKSLLSFPGKDIFEYELKFKSTSNAGRIFVFAQFGIPVVSDMFPSALQIIRDGEDGFLCYNPESWYFAFNSLTRNAEMRREMGVKLHERIGTEGFLAQMNANLIAFIHSL